jgi:hypothetical protein
LHSTVCCSLLTVLENKRYVRCVTPTDKEHIAHYICVMFVFVSRAPVCVCVYVCECVSVRTPSNRRGVRLNICFQMSLFSMQSHCMCSLPSKSEHNGDKVAIIIA